MSVLDLLERDAPAWARATRHPFLAAVRDGTLAPHAFAAWLVQDYAFVADLLWLQARLLARAPRPAQPVLASGALALVDELAWFEERAGGLGLDLTEPPLPATLAYRALLERLDAADPPAALTALWAVERAYLDAWSFAAPGAQYREIVAHWTTPEFAAYVDALAEAADGALAGTPPPAELFAEVVAAEVAFWDMAWTGGTA